MRHALAIVTGLALVLGVVGEPRVSEASDPDTCVLRGRYLVSASGQDSSTNFEGPFTLTPNADCALAGTIDGQIVRKDKPDDPGDVPVSGTYSVAADSSILFTIDSPNIGTLTGRVGSVANDIAGSFTFAGASGEPTLFGIGIHEAFAVPGPASGAAASGNTELGQGALADDTSGSANTALGLEALHTNTTGNFNTAAGATALAGNTTGRNNIAVGIGALLTNTTGNFNTGVGATALAGLTTGSSNTALGNGAGSNLEGGEHDNIHIGHFGVAGETTTMRLGSVQTRTFIAGIRGVTPGGAGAVPVLIDANGQFGTASSSRQVKTDIQALGDDSEALVRLQPVSFRYAAHAGHPGPREYGLIAEDVADVFPDLVVYDRTGRPEMVRYHLLPAMLLNEFQKQHRTLTEQAGIIEAQQEAIATLTSRLEALERLLPHYASR
jgi:hypothetical protein